MKTHFLWKTYNKIFHLKELSRAINWGQLSREQLLGGYYPGGIIRGQFSRCQLSGANFSGDHCLGATFRRAIILETIVPGAIIRGGNCARTKNTMETYSLFKKPVSFMYFWLNYCDGNHHIERIPSAVKNMDHLFCMASEIIEFDVFNLFLLSDGTPEQIQKLSVYFELKRYLSLKNVSYPLDIYYFLWYSKITLIFTEAFISRSCLSCSKCFLIVVTYDLKQAKRVWKE